MMMEAVMNERNQEIDKGRWMMIQKGGRKDLLVELV